MKIYHSLNEFKAVRNPVITIGTFDGVHVGHQKILAGLRQYANQAKGEVVLLTFHPHPRKILFPEQPAPELLNSLDEKIRLLQEQGVDHLVIQSFTTEFGGMEYDDFVKQVLVRQLGVHILVIGYDHQFGRNRKGNISTLRAMSDQLGFQVIEIPEQDIDHAAVSSTRIRTALKQGDVTTAATLLGYSYSLSGKVVHGKKLGKQLGYPTANIQPNDPDKLIPGNGIYAVRVWYDERHYGGMLNIGTRPTFDDGERSIEVNIFEFDKEIYGETLQLEFVKRIRDEVKFNSADELVQRIDQDKTESLRILSSW
jgi:riboflavin kinase / FMN adenylyltransferase